MAIQYSVVSTIDDVLNPDDGFLSLREAIIEANQNPTDQYVIYLAEGGTYPLTIPGSNEQSSRRGDLDITGNITVQTLRGDGTEGGVSTIAGSNFDRVFEVWNQGILNLTNVTITGGTSNQGGGILTHQDSGGTFTRTTISNNTVFDNGYGGGIHNSGNLTITDSNINNNNAHRGGGIYNTGNGNITINTSNIIGNRSAGFFNTGTATVNDSTFSDNVTQFSGGGIDNGNGNIAVYGSTFANNHANVNGGGFFNTAANSYIFNSTFTNNSANKSGGGLFNETELTVLTNVTISENLANKDLQLGGDGGGLAIKNGRVIAKNTIIANNEDSPGFIQQEANYHPDVSGNITGNANNLIGDLQGSTGGIGGGSDIVNPNPLLGLLANNGGPTQTMALFNGSPALDAGNNDFVTELPLDQRGLSRIINEKTDIGAYEDQTSSGGGDNGGGDPNDPTYTVDGITFKKSEITDTTPEGTTLIKDVILPTPLYRMVNKRAPHSYFYVGQDELNSIVNNPDLNQFLEPDYNESGSAFAFRGSLREIDDLLVPTYRYQHRDKDNSGFGNFTYSYATEDERSIYDNDPNFFYEGISWLAFPTGSGFTENIYRLKNTKNPVDYTMMFSGQGEKDFILNTPPTSNFFVDDGAAFESILAE